MSDKSPFETMGKVAKNIFGGSIVKVDHERNQAIVQLSDLSPKALFVSKGSPALIELPEYGEVTFKVHEGSITNFRVTESHTYQSLAIK